MHVRRVGEREHLVVLQKEERVVATLLRLATEQGIQGGWISGLGSLKDIELGYYDLPRRTYIRRKFEEDMELVGGQGNFAMHGAEPVLHFHCAVSGPELISLAGHLFEAKVAVTAEFLVKDFGVRVDRAEVPEIGLKLIQPEKPSPEKPGRGKESAS